MKTILCVEDERRVLENNRDALTRAGYAVLTAENLAQARDVLSRETPDAVVLDIMLPDGNGLDFLKELRASGSRLPIIMLTAWNRGEDIARGLSAGANDYLGKPFAYEVLLARIEAMFRNVEQVPEAITRGPLRLDINVGRAFLNGEDLLLTQKEFSLLLLLVRNEGRVMSAAYLLEKVWEQPMEENANAVRVMISRLRKKLAGSGLSIEAERGEGYCFRK